MGDTSFKVKQANGRMKLENVQHPRSSQKLNTLKFTRPASKLILNSQDSLASRGGTITGSKESKYNGINTVHNDWAGKYIG